MAIVTVELGHLLNRTNFKLFDFDYQFDDPQMKKTLEDSVLDFYQTYEIGRATPDAFKRSFITRWRRIMLYYNQLYNTTLLSYNPLINHKMNEAMEQLAKSTSNQDTTTNTDNTSNSTQSATSDGTDSSTEDSQTDQDGTTTNTQNVDSNTKSSDYPQQSIAGGDFLNGEQETEQTTTGSGTSENTTVGKSSRKGQSHNESEGQSNTTDKGKTVGSSQSTGSTTTDYSRTMEGLTGRTYQELIQLERDLILRIPQMVIEEMKPCFILAY